MTLPKRLTMGLSMAVAVAIGVGVGVTVLVGCTKVVCRRPLAREPKRSGARRIGFERHRRFLAGLA